MITKGQVRTARELLGWTVATLAKRSRRRLATIEAAERGIASLHTWIVLQQVLEAAGVEFFPEDGGGTGMRLRKPAWREDPKGAN